MATIKSTFDGKKMSEEILKSAQDILDRELQLAVTEIIQRTRQGRDVDGGAFDDYSAGYKKYKTKRGRSGAVDLTFTGKMLAAMQSKVERMGNGLRGTISFDSSNEASKAEYNNRTRKFFGLSTAQLARINRALNKIIRG